MYKNDFGIVVESWEAALVKGTDIDGEAFEVPASQDAATGDYFFWLHGETWYRKDFAAISHAQVVTTLDLSLRHVDKESEQFLKHQSESLVDKLIVHKTESGYLILILNDTEDEDLPADLKAVVRYAKKKECYWLFLHHFGPINPELPLKQPSSEALPLTSRISGEAHGSSVPCN